MSVVRPARAVVAFLVATLLTVGAFQSAAAQSTTCPAGAGAAAGESARRLAFELDFGVGSPYFDRYGEAFSALDYQRKAAVTAEVLDYVVETALQLTGAVATARSYGPGGYEEVVNPSGQVDLCDSSETVQDVMRIIGYLAQQTEVYGSRPVPTAENSAIDIYQTNGSDLADPEVASDLFNRLGQLEPALYTGFQPLAFRDAGGAVRVGIRIINTEGEWTAQELAQFGDVVERAARELNQARGLNVVGAWDDLKVELMVVGNPWRTTPDGSDYLQGLSPGRRSEIPRALVDRHRPEVERRIRAALARYGAGPAIGPAPAQIP
jgi:hypothetical protein